MGTNEARTERTKAFARADRERWNAVRMPARSRELGWPATLASAHAMTPNSGFARDLRELPQVESATHVRQALGYAVDAPIIFNTVSAFAAPLPEAVLANAHNVAADVAARHATRLADSEPTAPASFTYVLYDGATGKLAGAVLDVLAYDAKHAAPFTEKPYIRVILRPDGMVAATKFLAPETRKDILLGK
jgi:hypothetical protein